MTSLDAPPSPPPLKTRASEIERRTSSAREPAPTSQPGADMCYKINRSPAAVLVAACCLASCASGLATGPLAADAKRQLVVAALKRCDQLAAMSSRGDPEGCSIALEELGALREAGAVFELGPNAHNRAMRVCSAELETVEALYAQLAAEDRQDAASLEALATIRLENDQLVEAAAALAELLAPTLEVKTTKLGRLLPRRKVRPSPP